MKTRSKIVKNSIATISLISVLIIIAYFLSNSTPLNTLDFSISSNNKNGNNLIINQRYNKFLEGSVLDNIYNIDVNVISLKQPKVLHKKLELTQNLYKSGNIKDIDISEADIEELREHQSFKKEYNTFFVTKNSLLASVNKGSTTTIVDKDEPDHVYIIPETRKSNRFEGLIQSFKKQPDNESGKSVKTSTKIIPSIKNWDSQPLEPFQKIDNALKFNEAYKKIAGTPPSRELNVFNYASKESMINSKLIRPGKKSTNINLGIVRDFSSDPLKSVINNVLIPSGLPETAANVDAVTRGMGLPSGSLESSYALAGSLGISPKDLSNPNTKLSSQTVASINTSKDYIGKELDLNNTTLADYYKEVLRSSSSTNIELGK